MSYNYKNTLKIPLSFCVIFALYALAIDCCTALIRGQISPNRDVHLTGSNFHASYKGCKDRPAEIKPAMPWFPKQKPCVQHAFENQ